MNGRLESLSETVTVFLCLCEWLRLILHVSGTIKVLILEDLTDVELKIVPV